MTDAKGIKSIVSREALHNSLVLANSKAFLPKVLPKLSLRLNPRPSSMFFLTLSLGSSGYFLASPPGSLPLQELKTKIDNIKIKIILRFLKEIIIKLVVNLIALYNILLKLLKV